MTITANPLLGQAMRAAGYLYSTWSFAAMPLIADSQGFPKRPFVEGWQHLRLPWKEHLYPLPWERAVGLGLILGEASANLAVLDIDDMEMADAAFALMADKTRCIRTIRKRGHIYFTEESPSKSTASEVEWQGKRAKVELKAAGTQVAAPPTPGYEHVGPRDQKPMVVPSIRAAWESLAAALGIQQGFPRLDEGAGYPKPWQAQVRQNSRNKNIYIEAHKLREAGMPLEEAIGLLQVRWERSYEHGDQDWREIEATIKSAYRKGPPWAGLEVGHDELGLLLGRE